jgi:hypothetical protein
MPINLILPMFPIMPKKYLSLLFFLLTLQGFCQSNKLLNDKPKKINSTKYSLKKRLDFYPLNQSTRITIVSFDKQVDSSNSLNTNRTPRYIYSLPKKNDTICFSKLSQTVSLNIKQVDTLSDILYNTCFRWTIRETNTANCYLPHNAILFFDKNDKVLDYIEICFDCSQLYFSNKKIKQFEQCDFAIDNLRKYFMRLGIKVSTKEFEPKTSHY